MFIPDIDLLSIHFKWKEIPSLNYLANLKGSRISRSQMDQLIYAIAVVLNEYIPLVSGAQIAVGIDAVMSNIVRVFHPRESDPTVLGKIFKK